MLALQRAFIHGAGDFPHPLLPFIFKTLPPGEEEDGAGLVLPRPQLQKLEKICKGCSVTMGRGTLQSGPFRSSIFLGKATSHVLQGTGPGTGCQKAATLRDGLERWVPGKDSLVETRRADGKQHEKSHGTLISGEL